MAEGIFLSKPLRRSSLHWTALSKASFQANFLIPGVSTKELDILNLVYFLILDKIQINKNLS